MGVNAKVYIKAGRSCHSDGPEYAAHRSTEEATWDEDEELVAAHERLGSASMIHWLSGRFTKPLTVFPDSVILNKILRNDSHSGDAITTAELPQLAREIRLLREEPGPEMLEVVQFLDQIDTLIAAARAQDNPIIFV